MPRRERPLGSADTVLLRFATDLRQLREKAGSPTYRELAGIAHYSATALSAAAGGQKAPSLAVTLAFVRACGGDAAEWESRWYELTADSADSTPSDQDDRPSPYVGLAAFQPEQAQWFFGRDHVVRDLISRVTQRRIVAVFGASGAGKSSVLRAGLLATARSQGLAGGRPWPTVLFTPGASPLRECAVQLAKLAGCTAAQALTELRADPGALPLLARQAMADQPDEVDLLLVVDQFEEVFTLCSDQAERDAFLDALVAVAGAADSRVRVVLGVRADFYGHCTNHPGLLWALRDAQVAVGPMTTGELRQAITQPAVSAECTVETALVSQLIGDATGQPGVLPLVSHALLETWRRRRGNTLTLSGYQAAGGIEHAIAHTAETAFTTLTEAQQRLARQVFLRLTALGDGTEDTKRRVSRPELDDTDPDTTAVIEHLASARLITVDQTGVTLTHEALIRHWPRLRQWLTEDREGLRLHRQLTEAAALWHSHDQDPGTLYRGVRLSLTGDWAARADPMLTPQEREFLDTSTAVEAHEAAQARRRSRRLRQLVAVLAVLLVIATASTVFAVRSQDTIVRQRNTAIAENVASDVLTLQNTNLLLAIQLGIAAHRIDPTTRTRDSLLSTLSASVISQPSEILATAISRDGRTMATASGDRIARLWDIVDPRQPAELATLSGHTEALNSVAFSPDGRTLATGSFDRTARLWDISDPRRPAALATLSHHGEDVSAVPFSPDGRTLVTASYDRTARLWNVADPRNPIPLASLTGHTDPITAAAFSPDGRTVATASRDYTVRLWNVTDPRSPISLPTLKGHLDTVNSVAFSPDGQTLATASQDRDARLWNVTDPRRPYPLATLTGHRSAVWTVAFSADGRTLATGSGDHTARTWSVADPRNPTPGVTLTNHSDAIVSVTFSADGRTLATTSWDRTAKLTRTDFDHVIATACDRISTPITKAEWNQHLPGIPYQPPCSR